MEATAPGFKRKLYGAMGRVPFATMPLTLIFTLVAAMGSDIYFSSYASAGEDAARNAQYTELSKRVEGITPMRSYVEAAREKAEVVRRLPAEALPPGTDIASLNQQAESLSAAFNAEVRETALAIGFAKDLSFNEIDILGDSLQRASGQKLDYAISKPSYISYGIHSCQAAVMAQPGFTRSETSLKQVRDCALEKGRVFSDMTLGGVIGIAGLFLGGMGLYSYLRVSIRKEDEALAAAAALQPQKIEAAIDSGTGRDIKVKPIKLGPLKASP